MLELLQMWAVMEALGLIFLPLTVTVFHNLPDRGWAFSKAIGLAVLAFCVWLPLMTLQFLPFSRLFILGVLLILVALNLLGFLRVRKTLLELVRSHVIYIVFVELIFFGMVFLLGWLRSYSPDIRNWEMFMDEGFLAGIMRSPHFPPNDMWYAGQSINYYYYAHYTIALLGKLIGQSPAIIFNTGICMFFGLTAVNLFGVTSNVVAWAQHRRRQRFSSSPTIVPGDPRPDSVFPTMRGAIPYGILSILLGEVLGNLAATQTWWQNHGDLPFDFWVSPSRVVAKTINEFPAFSFLLSCFHAHVLTLAFTIVGVALAFNLFLEPDGQGLSAFGRGWRLPLTLGVTALLIGSLYTMNGWDYPTYLALALVGLVLQQWLAHQTRLSWDLVLDTFTVCASLGVLSFFLFAPFYLNFVSPALGLSLVGPGDRSPLANEVLIYGIFTFIFISLLLVNFFRPRLLFQRVSVNFPGMNGSTRAGPLNMLASRLPIAMSPAVASVQDEGNLARSGALNEMGILEAEDDSGVVIEDLEPAAFSRQAEEAESLSTAGLGWRDMRFAGLLAMLLVGLVLLLVVKNSPTLVVAGDLAAMSALLVLYHLKERERAFILLLGAVAFALIAFCEVIFLRDVFVDQDPRMNTVFKFYFQAWALLSITGGAGVYFILESLRPALKLPVFSQRLYTTSRVLWFVALLVFLLMGAVYPLAAPRQRLTENHPLQRSNSLDGLAYLSTTQPGDYLAITWINQNITGDPVIVEAFGSDYSDYGRVSSFTGLPTIMGWAGHEIQWRINWLNKGINSIDFSRRADDIKQIYTDQSSQDVLTLLARYNAQYIYVGANLQRFQSFMQIVYQQNGVTIYKVR